MAVSHGYKNVYHFPHGLQAWQEQGLPVASASFDFAPSEKKIGASALSGWAMLWTLLGIFFGGMALNLTPCVYPMIPITVSYFGGRAAGSEVQQQGKLLIHGLSYLLGLVFTYSLLGVIASLTGSLLGGMLQNPAVLVAVALILACFAASLFGLWEMRLPAGLTQAAAKSYQGYFGSLFMGLALGIVAAPCLGPFVLGIFTWVASMGNPWTGFLVFFILSLGLGLPLFFLALFSGQMKRLPRSGGWMIWIRYLMGWVLLVMAAYYMRLVLPSLWGTVLMAVLVAAAGVHLGWIGKNRTGGRLFPWIKTLLCVGCLVWAAFTLTGYAMQGAGVTWNSYSDDILEKAQADKKPVIIDFYAKWCAPCRELDDVTFRASWVVRMAGRDFVFIRVDVSKAGDPLNEELIQKYNIRGVPTVVFLDVEGKEKTELRLVDYLPPNEFLLRMEASKK